MARISLIIRLQIVMIAISINAVAQGEDCEQTLSQATQEFQAGHFYAVPLTLAPCQSKFTNEQQIRANILLTQAYLLLDDTDGAKRSYLRVLKANPEFVADENMHPVDVVYLSKKFITTPVFAWFFKAGLNTTPIRVVYDVDLLGADVQEYYRLRPGYNAAIGFDFYFREKMALRMEANYLFTSYQHSTRQFFQDDTKDFVENQMWITFPVSYVYGKRTGKYQPYAYGGFNVMRLVRDVASQRIQKVQTAEGEKDDQESPTWNFLYKRNRTNYSLLAGGGLKTKIGLNYIFIDARYMLGLLNVVKRENLYANNSLDPSSEDFITSGTPSSSFGHADDLFRLDNISFSVGFLRPIYKPREIRARKSGRFFWKRNKSR